MLLVGCFSHPSASSIKTPNPLVYPSVEPLPQVVPFPPAATIPFEPGIVYPNPFKPPVVTIDLIFKEAPAPLKDDAETSKTLPGIALSANSLPVELAPPVPPLEPLTQSGAVHVVVEANIAPPAGPPILLSSYDTPTELLKQAIPFPPPPPKQ